MKFQIELRQEEFKRLREIAEKERREWRAQAAYLLSKVLEQKQSEQVQEARRAE